MSANLIRSGLLRTLPPLRLRHRLERLASRNLNAELLRRLEAMNSKMRALRHAAWKARHAPTLGSFGRSLGELINPSVLPLPGTWSGLW
jgi:hypothetical protein